MHELPSTPPVIRILLAPVKCTCRNMAMVPWYYRSLMQLPGNQCTLYQKQFLVPYQTDGFACKLVNVFNNHGTAALKNSLDVSQVLSFSVTPPVQVIARRQTYVC